MLCDYVMSILCMTTWSYISSMNVQLIHNEKKKDQYAIIYKLFVYIFVSVTKI